MMLRWYVEQKGSWYWNSRYDCWELTVTSTPPVLQHKKNSDEEWEWAVVQTFTDFAMPEKPKD